MITIFEKFNEILIVRKTKAKRFSVCNNKYFWQLLIIFGFDSQKFREMTDFSFAES